MTVYAASNPLMRPAPVASGVRTRMPRLVAVDTVSARRRRRTVAVVLIAVVAAIVGPRAMAGDESVPAVEFDTYTVAAGETLWSIASALTPAGDDVHETVGEIKELNAKTGSALRTGEQLLIPALD